MTEHSGQTDPAEALRRTISEQAAIIQSHDSVLRPFSEQQHTANQGFPHSSPDSDDHFGLTFSFQASCRPQIITSTTGFLLSGLPVRIALQPSEPSGLHLRYRQTNHNSFSGHLSLSSSPRTSHP
ncbi:hypothetical protein AMECASPLE_030726 [Ameca splendens]|uniref:Uncharacterized protein n=1 Tax=Ameca splendens TaxID=208324 RepID=A0ABV0YUP8_9TELE